MNRKTSNTEHTRPRPRHVIAAECLVMAAGAARDRDIQQARRLAELALVALRGIRVRTSGGTP